MCWERRSLCHLLNDMLQSLFIAAYPIFKGNFHLSFGQIGVLTLVFQITASLLQPLVGDYTDRKPMPYSLPFGMAISMSGLLVLAFAQHYAMLLIGGALLGVGSSIFHPESSRLARLASGGAHGMAQSVFQVGGNFGQSIGPLLMLFLVLPEGSKAWPGLRSAALFGHRPAGRPGPLVSAARTRHPQEARRGQKYPRSAEKRCRARSRCLVVLTFSKYLLSGQHHQLLRVLPDAAFPRSQKRRAARPVLLPAAVAGGTVTAARWVIG